MAFTRVLLALLYIVSCDCRREKPRRLQTEPFPGELTPNREPEYQPLKGYLPVSTEQGRSKCDPCARKYVFVLAAGRSGSTTLFGMLNQLPEFSVLYECHPELNMFGKLLETAGEVEKKMLITPGDEHGAKDGVLTSVDFACWAQDWFDHHGYRPAHQGGLAQWNFNSNSTAVRGFKLVHANSDKQMSYLKSLFPCARFIYRYREDITSFDLFKLRESQVTLENEKKWLTKWSQQPNPWRSQTWRFALESFGDLKNWDGLLEWLGLPDCHTQFVLHYHAHHMYSFDQRGHAIRCTGESTNGVVGEWSTDHWLDVDSKNESLAVIPSQETSHPEPTYKGLEGILPLKVKFGNHPICDPCAKKYVFILAAGNSGSGPLKSVLNLLPHFEILSKRHPLVYVFGEMMRIAARDHDEIPTFQHFYNETAEHEGRMTSVDFACWTQDWFDHHVSTDAFLKSEVNGSERPWSAKNTIRGFELRTASHDYRMAELKSLFPCARFIYTYQENVDEASVSEDHGDLSFYRDEVLWMKKWSGEENSWRDQTWQFPVEKYEDVAYWNEFLQWLGLPNCSFEPGVYSDNGEALPIQCKGDGTLNDDGDVGGWGTQHWLDR